jgi:PrtD family type I secretion system ABC transporter
MENADNKTSASSSELREATGICRRSFWIVFLFSIVANLLLLAFPLYMLQVYDRVLTTSHTETLLMLTLVVGGALLLMGAIDGLRTALTLRIGGWLVKRLGPTFMRSNVQAQLAGRGVGATSISDLTTLRNFIATQGLTFFCDAPWVPVFVTVIWLVHPMLGMLALTSAVILFILSVMNERATRAPLHSAAAANFAARRDADAMVRNAEVVSAMGMLPALVGRWERVHDGVLAQLQQAGERSGYLVGLTKFVRMFAQVGVLGLGALLVIRGEFTPGAMIACSILLGRALAPVEMAMGAWKNFTETRIAYRRLRDQLAAFPPALPRTRLPEPTGALKVDGLHYEINNRKILDGIKFELEPGDALAVIGPSGAGKSTLCRFLVGIDSPTSGEVRLDDSSIAHWDRSQLGRHLGFLPQSVELFSGTVRENIGRMSVCDDADVVDAARLAHAHRMIQQLPQGYDTTIGDGGVGLSGGQRQRIGLARAVFGDPKLIVLDEPNANLDQAGESALAAAISELKARAATIVMVGHRPSTLAEATKILLIKDGRVQLFGPRDEVLGKLRAAQSAPTRPEPESTEADTQDKQQGTTSAAN